MFGKVKENVDRIIAMKMETAHIVGVKAGRNLSA
jgi:hypothetical protein